MQSAVPVRVPIRTDDVIDPIMFQPLADAGQQGYVPLCSAIHWIMTGGGARQLTLDDNEAWTAASEKLRLLIQTGQVDIIGLPRGGSMTDTIPGRTFGLIRLISPVDLSFSDLGLDAPSFIQCASFVDREEWFRNYNDRLFERGESTATWSHLQVKKADILDRWPRPDSKVKAESDCLQWLLGQIEQSLTVRPKPKVAFWAEARGKFRSLKRRQFNRIWDRALVETGAKAWSRPGPRPRQI